MEQDRQKKLCLVATGLAQKIRLTPPPKAGDLQMNLGVDKDVACPLSLNLGTQALEVYAQEATLWDSSMKFRRAKRTSVSRRRIVIDCEVT